MASREQWLAAARKHGWPDAVADVAEVCASASMAVYEMLRKAGLDRQRAMDFMASAARVSDGE